MIECSRENKTSCKEQNTFIIHNTCYFFYQMQREYNAIENQNFCLKKNMTSPDFPTYHNFFVMRFISSIFHEQFTSLDSKNNITYQSKKTIKLFFNYSTFTHFLYQVLKSKKNRMNSTILTTISGFSLNLPYYHSNLVQFNISNSCLL